MILEYILCVCVGVWHFSPPSSFLLWARYHLIYSLIERVCTILQEVSTRLWMVKVSNYLQIKPWLSSLRLRSQLAILLVRAASFWQMADATSQHHPSWCIIEKDRKGNPWAWVVHWKKQMQGENGSNSARVSFDGSSSSSSSNRSEYLQAHAGNHDKNSNGNRSSARRKNERRRTKATTANNRAKKKSTTKKLKRR